MEQKPKPTSEYNPWVLLAVCHEETILRFYMKPGTNLLYLPPDHVGLLDYLKKSYKAKHKELLGTSDIIVTVLYTSARREFSTLAEFISHRGGLYKVTILNPDGTIRYKDHLITQMTGYLELHQSMQNMVAESDARIIKEKEESEARIQKMENLVAESDARRIKEKEESEARIQKMENLVAEWEALRKQEKETRSATIDTIIKLLECSK
eukprot:TRINITY_DN1750_c0_g1_i1.p1 TRINITY_DN1750_c0_g1~~TRINITY_DN1750_c0_g1_i1.p1  ORF type:complete len:209 (+),score=22.46 TRINITY_DN1750_c0_g1_i1:72-698(+)